MAGRPRADTRKPLRVAAPKSVEDAQRIMARAIAAVSKEQITETQCSTIVSCCKRYVEVAKILWQRDGVTAPEGNEHVAPLTDEAITLLDQYRKRKEGQG